MSRFRPVFLLLAACVLLGGNVLAAPLPATGTLVFSDLCRTASGFRGSRLTLIRAPGGDSGEYQWGDTAAATAPLDQLGIGADGKIAFRYMPDADNPEIFIRVSGGVADDGFQGEADGKPLRIPRAAASETVIPSCR